MTSNQIAYEKVKADREHYARQDNEARRHNVESELINWYTGKGNVAAQLTQAAASSKQADAAALRSEVQQSQLGETIRHNQQTEFVDKARAALTGIDLVSDLGKSILGGFFK